MATHRCQSPSLFVPAKLILANNCHLMKLLSEPAQLTAFVGRLLMWAFFISSHPLLLHLNCKSKESKDILSELVTADQFGDGFAELPKLQSRFACTMRRQLIYRAFDVYCPIRVGDLDIP